MLRKTALLLLIHFGAPTLALAIERANYSASLDLQSAQHTSKPQDSASQKAVFQFEQFVGFNKRWSGVFGVHGFYEGQYKNHPDDYPKPLRDQDTQDFRLHDTFLEYRTRDWSTKIGNQQVVWGESFGTSYLDLVNPKDLREGQSLNFSKIRLPNFMLNVKYSSRKDSLQMILIPRPLYNIMALPGSDFSSLLQETTAFKDTQITREKEGKPGNLEYGLRYSQNFKKVDLSYIFFSYFDRYPNYRPGAATAPPDLLVLDEHHARITSYGLAFAADLDGYLVRGEGIFTNGRRFHTKDGETFGLQTTDETAYTVSVDLPTWSSLNVSLQIAESRFLTAAPYFQRQQLQQFGGARLLWSFENGSNLQMVWTPSLTDKGSRLQGEYMYPLGSRFELQMGAESYEGTSESDFGRLRRASRVYLLLKSFFRG